jgi:hypothetical protein
VPGVLVDRINVGGSEAGNQSHYVNQGTELRQSQWVVDGVVVTDMGALGASPSYFNFDSFEELQITTGGADVSLPTGGAALNLVTPRGTNEWHGSGRYFTGSGVDESAFERAPPVRNRLFDRVTEYTANLGGPIVRDRLWGWGAYSNTTAGQLASAADGRTANDYSGGYLEFTVTAQAAPHNRVTMSYFGVNKERQGVGASPDRAASSLRTFDSTERNVRLEDTHIFNSNFYLTGLASFATGGFQLVPEAGTAVLGDDRVWRNSFLLFDSDRSQEQAKVEGNYFFDAGSTSHELKFGFGYRRSDVVSLSSWPTGGFSVDRDPFVQRVVTTSNESGTSYNHTNLYVQDTLTLGNLTASVGVRYDREAAGNDPSRVIANPARPTDVPGGTFAGGEAFEWSDISPRLGLTYAIGQERKTLLRASYSQFADQLGTSLAAVTNPVRLVPYAYGLTYLFSDSDRNYLRGANEPKGSEVRVGGLAASDPRALNDPDSVADDLRGARLDEWFASIAREWGRWVLSADLTKRHVTNIIDDLPTVFDGTGERLARRPDYIFDRSVTGTDLNGRPFSVPLQRLRTGLTPLGTHFQNGSRATDYTGVTFSFDRRLANRWMLRGNATWSDWTWDVPDSEFGDANDLLSPGDNDGAPGAAPAASDKAGLFLSAGWSFSIYGLGRVAPDRPWGFDVSADLYARQGYIMPLYTEARGGDNEFRTIQVGDFSQRLPNVAIVNLQVSKRVGLKAGTLTVFGEVLNATDTRAVLQEDRQAESRTYRQVLEVVSPRVIRLGARIEW